MDASFHLTGNADKALRDAIAAAVSEQGPGAVVQPWHLIGPLLGNPDSDLPDNFKDFDLPDPAIVTSDVDAALARLPVVDIGVELPVDGDLLFCSVFGGAAAGESAEAVLKTGGWDADQFQPVEPKIGFSFFGDIGVGQGRDRGSQRPVMIVASHAQRQRANKALPENLTKAIESLPALPDGFSLWLPLMGSGAGGLSPIESLHITVAALREGGLFDKMNGGRVTFSLGANQADALPELQAYLKDIFPTYRDIDEAAAEQRALMAQELCNDQPSAIDHFGHEPLVRALAEFISTPGTKPPLVIGIDAPWGAGKSSVMKMLQNRLKPGTEDRVEDQARKRSRPLNWNDIADLQRLAKREPEEKGDGTGAPKRVFETVYFNAWRHGSGERLTASLVNAVIQFVTASRGSTFWVRLNLNRIDTDEIKQQLFTKFIAATVPRLVGLVGLGAVAVIGLLLIPVVDGWWGEGTILSALVGYGVFFRLIWKKFKDSPLELGVEKYFRVPDYNALMGPLSEIEQDFRLVLEALRDEDGRKKEETILVIFIDDLDRCGPGATAKIVETINVFFGQETENCIFILGMHKHMVAASLEMAYEKLTEHAKNDPTLAEELPFGRRFLEKIVQFHVRIPDPDDRVIERYLAHLTGARTADMLSFEERAEIRVQVDAQGNPPSDDEAVEKRTEAVLEAVAPAAEGNEASVSAEKQEAIREQIEGEMRLQRALRFDEKDPDVLRVFQTVQFALRRNPRQYVRFLNALRFANFLDSFDHRDRSGTAAEQILDLAKREVLGLEWPDVHMNLVALGADFEEFFREFHGRFATQDLLRKYLDETLSLDKNRLDALVEDTVLAGLAAAKLA